MKKNLTHILLATSCICLISCGRVESLTSTGTTYKMETVQFVEKKDNDMDNNEPGAPGTLPGIFIDTNPKISGLAGGSIKSRKPYSAAIDYTDETLTFDAVEFTIVRVIYEDGTIDPAVEALELPLRIQARPYEATNSVAGGKTEKTDLRVISGKIPGIISNDQPLELHLEGHFIKNDKTTIDFKIRRKYEVIIDDTTRTWSEVMQDI